MPLINGQKMACVTAAIPRKQKCGCGSSNAGTPAESPSVVKAESPASDVPPMSPTKASAASFRIQKSAPKAASRKQSFDPVNLERMDATNINILPPYDMAQANHMPHANGGMPSMPTPRNGMEYGGMTMMGGVNGGFHQPIIRYVDISAKYRIINRQHLTDYDNAHSDDGVEWGILLLRKDKWDAEACPSAIADEHQHGWLMLLRAEQSRGELYTAF
ncbi:uncharacterized protein N0V96_005382 [Colletotrichum fioriniae]|uniref:uncharacterized protein n=1 Tax=Colletotrichum fioriniae TaxID=710243 RepID=UPI0032DA8E84|nr:hypothetical protein N0V96_005382 [Colletotrichum fioriniae]